MTIVSADVKFIPSPPAFVDNKNTLYYESYALNKSINLYLFIFYVSPSNLSDGIY
jgi:hypothetical protein